MGSNKLGSCLYHGKADAPARGKSLPMAASRDEYRSFFIIPCAVRGVRLPTRGMATTQPSEAQPSAAQRSLAKPSKSKARDSLAGATPAHGHGRSLA